MSDSGILLILFASAVAVAWSLTSPPSATASAREITPVEHHDGFSCLRPSPVGFYFLPCSFGVIYEEV